MKKFFGILLLLAMFAPKAHATFPPDVVAQALLTRANVYSPLEGLGTVVNQTKNLMKCVYDFTVLGGAAGFIPLVDDQGNACRLPTGAIVTRTTTRVVTALTSSGFPNLTVGVATAADLKATVALGAVTGYQDGVQTGAASLAIGPIVATSAVVNLNVITTALTAGKMDVFLEYVIQ